MKIFSAKNVAQCPNCGEMKPTNATPQQIEDGDWECTECYNRSGKGREEEKSIERGQKEISKYDPEYEFLVRLVKLVTKEGVPAQEIKDLSNAYPFVTVDDVGDLTAKIWTLATQKYQIPGEWLTKKLPKSAKKANNTYDEEWQSQKETQDMLDHAPGYLAYDYGQDKTSKAKKININDVIQILNAGEPKIIKINTAEHTLELSDGSTLSFDDATKKAMEIDKTGVFSGSEFSNTEFNTNPTLDNGPYSSPEDQGAKPQKQPFPNTNWLPADDENQDEQPWSNVAASRRISKKANPDTRYWVAPDGTEFPVTGVHGSWIKQNPKILQQYGIKPDDNFYNTILRMKQDGWVRVSNEPAGTGFQIEVNDINQLPSFIDDVVARHFTEGDTILVGNAESAGVEITNPFPSLQDAVNKALARQSRASLKQAAIAGQVVNEVLQNIHSAGGTTYNIAKGNLAGTPNFAVSIYPDRERIVDGVDFDVLEGYMEENEDLLSDANNSFWAWSNGGKVYLDVVATLPDRARAINLATQHNQIAIWDLQNNQEIPTGGTGGGNVRAFSKSVMSKTAEENILCDEDQDAIAAASSPVYVMAVNNYAEALKRGHDKDRSLEYAIESVQNLDKIDPKKLVEFINTYL